MSQSHGIALLIRWVLVRDPLVRDPLVRDPLVRFDPQALLCTDLALVPLAIVQHFIQRWQVEVIFEEARRHLGPETQRQWSDKAVARTTPVLLSLFSFVTLLARPTRPCRHAADPAYGLASESNADVQQCRRGGARRTLAP